MFNKFMNLLAISVSELNPVQDDGDEKQKAIWIVVLIAVVIACVLLSRLKLDLGGKIKEKKAERVKKKAEKLRDEELDRLHKIKKKNQRK